MINSLQMQTCMYNFNPFSHEIHEKHEKILFSSAAHRDGSPYLLRMPCAQRVGSGRCRIPVSRRCVWFALFDAKKVISMLMPALLTGVLLTGCQTSSRFSEPLPFAVSDIEPSQVPARFSAKMASQFEEVYSLVFHYRWAEFAAVGMASVDTKTRSLAVTCMTPLGVKIFDVICKGGVLEKAFVLPALGEQAEQITKSAGEDLMRAYFDVMPPSDAAWIQTKSRLIFKVKDAQGITEYRYAWQDGRLAEKLRVEKGDTLWCIEYRDYTQTPAGLMPTGFMIRNKQRGYSIEVTKCQEEK